MPVLRKPINTTYIEDTYLSVTRHMMELCRRQTGMRYVFSCQNDTKYV